MTKAYIPEDTYTLHNGERVVIHRDNIVRHRNGIGGLGFWSMFLEHDGTTFIASLDDDGRVQVVNPADLTQTLRGHDWYGPVVRAAVLAGYVHEYGAGHEDDVPALVGA